MSLFASIHKMLPRWLTDDDGGKVAASLALTADDFIARARLGLLARFPSYAPDDDALAAIGRDRRIVRGINEPRASYAARLSRAFDDHKRRGNPFAMLQQLRAYLQANCVVRTVDRRGNWYTVDAAGAESCVINAANWNWDGVSVSQWSRFWTIIYPEGGTKPWAPSGNIGSSTLWGDGKIGHSNLTIGTTATRDQCASVWSIIRDWKPAGTKCEWVIIAFDSASFSPAGSTDPAGEWGNWSKTTAGGDVVPVRLATARYWSPE